jgi:hypothetical protein
MVATREDIILLLVFFRSLRLYGPIRSGVGLPTAQRVIAATTSRSLPENP